MASDTDTIPRTCFQCGRATQPLNLDQAAFDSGWICCEGCGERIVSVEDAAALMQAEQEKAVRDRLGVDRFLEERRLARRD